LADKLRKKREYFYLKTSSFCLRNEDKKFKVISGK
jgi:hypothetical protein